MYAKDREAVGVACLIKGMFLKAFVCLVLCCGPVLICFVGVLICVYDGMVYVMNCELLIHGMFGSKRSGTEWCVRVVFHSCFVYSLSWNRVFVLL